MSVGGVSADKFTSIHSDIVQEVGTEAEAVVEDTVYVEETPEETTVSMNDIDAEYANLVIAKVNDYVNVRSDASEEAEIVGKLYDKSVGTYLSEKDGWYEIASGNCRGYVKAEYVVTGTDAIALAKEVGKRIATVTTTTLYVREMPSTETSVIGMVPIEDELTVVEEGVDEGWIKVSIEEGEGYVSSEFVTLTTEFVKAESKAEEEARLAAEEAARKKANVAAAKSAGGKSSKSASVSGGSGTGSAVASYALQFVGNPYVYGGSSLTNGTDCSGFVMSVYAHFGVGLPHSSGAQRGCGYDVGGLGNAQPGDIVCYSGHVGIYIGGGQIVHASTAATGIKVSNAGYRQVLSVRRIF
ncbi:MAG: SH3 domain-containing protein [Lachnospiraceae bacterium]|nr:SH3 domain-containing protein [Lachnospiraceae bacterium]